MARPVLPVTVNGELLRRRESVLADLALDRSLRMDVEHVIAERVPVVKVLPADAADEVMPEVIVSHVELQADLGAEETFAEVTLNPVVLPLVDLVLAVGGKLDPAILALYH